MPPPLEEHPLVKYYGLSVEHLALTKAHRQVEGGHRAAAWKAILENVVPMRRGAVVRAMKEALELLAGVPRRRGGNLRSRTQWRCERSPAPSKSRKSLEQLTRSARRDNFSRESASD